MERIYQIGAGIKILCEVRALMLAKRKLFYETSKKDNPAIMESKAERDRSWSNYDRDCKEIKERQDSLKEECTHAVILNLGRVYSLRSEDSLKCAFCGKQELVEQQTGFYFDVDKILNVSKYKHSAEYIAGDNILYTAITNFILDNWERMSPKELMRYIEDNYITIADEIYNAPKEKRLALMGIKDNIC
jgi:hypothetical protein